MGRWQNICCGCSSCARPEQERLLAADTTGCDFVTIMTIHKSKGLEFPVVFVPALDAKGKGDTDMLRFNADAGLGIKVDIGGELQDTSVMLAIKDIESSWIALKNRGNYMLQ